MTESKHYHHWKDGNEYDTVVYLDDEGKGNSYGHGIRTETTMKHWQGNEFVTHEDIYGNVVYTDVRSPDGSHIEKYQDATGRWWRESYGPDGKGVRETIDEWDGDYPDDSSENVDNWHTPEEGQSPIGRISQGQGEEPSPYDGFEDENLGQDHLPPPWIEGEENHTGGRLPLPDDTGIQAQDNLAKGHLPGLLDEEPPTEQPPPAEPPVQPNPPPPDQGLQENYAKDYGFPGLGVEPPPSSTPEDLAKQQAEERARAEEELGPQTPPSPTPEDLGIQERYGKDHNIPDLVEEPAPAPPVPGLGVQENYAKDYGFAGLVEEVPPEGNDPTQLHPNLLDPIAPGPTLDTGLVERIEQSPALVDRVNQDPAVAEALERDPTQLDQIAQYLGVAEQRPTEPSGGTDLLGGATDPSLTDAGSTAGQDGHDRDDVFEGI